MVNCCGGYVIKNSVHDVFILILLKRHKDVISSKFGFCKMAAVNTPPQKLITVLKV